MNLKYLYSILGATIGAILLIPVTLYFSDFICYVENSVILEGKIVDRNNPSVGLSSIQVAIVGKGTSVSQTDKDGRFSNIIVLKSKRKQKIFRWLSCPECSPVEEFELNIGTDSLICTHYLDLLKESVTGSKLKRTFTYPSRNCK